MTELRDDDDRPLGGRLAAGQHDRRRDGVAASGAESGHAEPASSRTLGDLARRGARLVLWVVLALILVRGVGDVVSDAEKGSPTPTAAAREFPGDAARAFAVGLARAYLTRRAGEDEAAARELDAMLAPSLRERFQRELPTSRRDQLVAAATVAASKAISRGRAIITVACIIWGQGATRFIAVPVARDARGGLVAFDLPALVAGPPQGQVESTEPDPLAGSEQVELDRLARRFLAAYVAGAGTDDLSFFVAPEASVGSLAPGLELAGVAEVGQLGDRDRARRSLLVSAHVRDLASLAVYPARYRLGLVRRERWYVESVTGEAS